MHQTLLAEQLLKVGNRRPGGVGDCVVQQVQPKAQQSHRSTYKKQVDIDNEIKMAKDAADLVAQLWGSNGQVKM